MKEWEFLPHSSQRDLCGTISCDVKLFNPLQIAFEVVSVTLITSSNTPEWQIIVPQHHSLPRVSQWGELSTSFLSGLWWVPIGAERLLWSHPGAPFRKNCPEDLHAGWLGGCGELSHAISLKQHQGSYKTMEIHEKTCYLGVSSAWFFLCFFSKDISSGHLLAPSSQPRLFRACWRSVMRTMFRSRPFFHKTPTGINVIISPL